MARTLWLYTALASAALVLGCGAKKPPKPPEPTTVEPAPELAERAPPPPKKKCEALDEACKALAGTKARVPHGPFTIEPVSGWIYAQLETATVAQTSPTGPCLAAVGFDPGDAKDAKKELANREAALEVAVKEAGLTLPKKKVGWKKPDEKKDVHGLKVRTRFSFPTPR